MNLLKEDLELHNSFSWTFISDRQKGNVPVLEEDFPNSEHRFCVRHMYNNFSKKHKGEALRSELWLAARATTVPMFNVHMERIKAMDEAAYDWLTKKSP